MLMIMTQKKMTKAKKSTKDLQELYEDLEAKRNQYVEARQAYDKAYEKSLNINFLGKFIKIEDDEPTYLYVKEQFLSKGAWDTETEYFLLRGFGFRYINTPYSDASYFNWDWFYTFKIYNDRTRESTLKKIKEITEDEFKSALYKGFQQTQEHIEKIFKSSYFNHE